MPPAVGGGIRYMAEGGVDGAGCIPLPVPENRPSIVRKSHWLPYLLALSREQSRMLVDI